MTTAHSAQADYWNHNAGPVWVEENESLDAMLAPLGEAAMAALTPRAGEAILDIGCGAGATSRVLATRVQPGGSVTAVDISAPLVDLAMSKGGDVAYICADAGRDPLPHAPFDAAFSRFGVMFFEDPVAAFTHIGAAMKPGGRIAFICWRGMAENAWARETLVAALPFLKAPPQPPEPHAPGPFAFADRDRTAGLLAAAGWRDIHIEPLDTDYVLGPSAAAAAPKMLRIGPLGPLIREQGIDPATIGDALTTMLSRYETPKGVAMPAACWVVTAAR
ncbi:MAG: methyltransferase domain-containing protein [Alphaproteobacteria bacterium]|nr:methyltransferase domain-containing protein [Alphaproteobacteria bacterium]